MTDYSLLKPSQRTGSAKDMAERVSMASLRLEDVTLRPLSRPKTGFDLFTPTRAWQVAWADSVPIPSRSFVVLS
jgi:hypothetical protein